ncbi:MAG: hypothetical protein HN348_11190 [Proteobacteria bacterium]|nr:hypothetical protein [Pseudomonadota bacterium]
MTNLAIGRYYLGLSMENTSDSALLRRSAQAHSKAAFAQKPVQAMELLQAIELTDMPAIVAPPKVPVRTCNGGTWADGDCILP